VSDEVLLFLATHVHSLAHLDVRADRVSDDGFGALAAASGAALTHAGLNYWNVGGAGVVSVVTACAKLRHLEVGR